MDPLAKLFGSPARLKLLRLFLFNDDMAFTAADTAFRTRTPKDAVRKELSVLVGSGIIRKKPGKEATYATEKKSLHYEALKVFVRTTTDLSDAYIGTALKKAGAMKLIVLSGLFTGALESKVDVLVVGDSIDEKVLATSIHSLEAELGRELRYASFSTEQFRYRLGVYDRLLRDVFDFPNRVIIDKLGVTSK